jgi:hypothetical protein
MPSIQSNRESRNDAAKLRYEVGQRDQIRCHETLQKPAETGSRIVRRCRILAIGSPCIGRWANMNK